MAISRLADMHHCIPAGSTPTFTSKTAHMLGTLSLDAIDEVLQHNIVGRIGCAAGEKVYIVPVSYAFNGTDLVIHSKEGMKIEMMRQNKHVCFQVDEIKHLASWRSVIVWGEYEEITDPKERYYAMKFLVGRLTQQPSSASAGIAVMEEELAHTQAHIAAVARPVVYRIRIKEKTGRFESE